MSSPRIRFTDQQGQYLAFIDAYTRVHGRPPAEADLQRHFRVSPPAVHRMVLTLELTGVALKDETDHGETAERLP